MKYIPKYIVLFAAVFLTIFMVSCESAKGARENSASALKVNIPDETINPFNINSMDEVKNNGLMSMITFYSVTCNDCEDIEPTVLKLRNDYSGKINIYKLDATRHEDIASKYSINEVPAFLFLDKSKKVIEISDPKNDTLSSSISGNYTEEEFVKILENIGIK